MNETIMTYVILIQKGRINLDNVPLEYREQVEEKLEKEEQCYGTSKRKNRDRTFQKKL